MFLYAGLGIVNYLFCNAVMLFVNIALSLPEATSLLLGFALQAAISFLLSRYVTFRNLNVSRFWLGYSILMVGLCYLIARVLLRDLFLLLLQTEAIISCVASLRAWLSVEMELAVFSEKLVMLLCTLTYSVINYIGQRYFVFRPKKNHTEAA